jgi:peptide/nickel transport system permease protein
MAATAIVTIFVASMIIYAGLSAAPGNPAVLLAGNRATPAMIASIQRRLGLDRPLPVRYVSWLWGVLHGNLGMSIQYRESVNSLIGPRIGNTLFLVCYAMLIIVVAGICGGMLPALIRRSNVWVTVSASITTAIPSFVAALLLIEVFALKLGWFPVLGSGGVGLLGLLRSMTLPAFALALAWVGYVAQITRTSVLEEEGREHVETARARGVRELRVFRRHVARNAAVPIVTVSAVTLAGLITGSIVVEQVFGINGIGAELVASVLAKDYNVVLVISMIYIVAFVIATTVIDLAQLALDPRVRARTTG